MAGRESTRSDAERHGADRPDQQTFAAAGARYLRGNDQQAGGEPQARAADRRQQPDQKSGLVSAGRMIEIDNLDAQTGVMPTHRVGEREGSECLPQQAERCFRVFPSGMPG